MSDQGDKSHDKIWYLKKGDKVFGPFASVKVRSFLMEGRIDLRDEVSLDKRNWSYLLSQPEVVPLQMRDPDAFSKQETSDELDPGKKGSLWLPILIVIILLAGGIAVSMKSRHQETANLPDCGAEPAPGIIWNSCNKRSMRAENVNLDGLVATNVVLNQARMSGSSFQNAILRYAQFENADLSYADFSGASLKGANLHGADLSNAVLNDADLRYADLSEARLGGVQIKNAQLGSAIWLNGKPCKPGSVGQCVQ